MKRTSEAASSGSPPHCLTWPCHLFSLFKHMEALTKRHTSVNDIRKCSGSGLPCQMALPWLQSKRPHWYHITSAGMLRSSHAFPGAAPSARRGGREEMSTMHMEQLPQFPPLNESINCSGLQMTTWHWRGARGPQCVPQSLQQSLPAPCGTDTPGLHRGTWPETCWWRHTVQP